MPLSARNAGGRLGPIVLLVACGGGNIDLRVDAPAPDSLSGCALTRRVSVQGVSGMVGELSGAARNIGDAPSPLELELEDDGSESWTLQVDELGSCGRLAVRGSMAIDPDTGRAQSDFAWSDPAPPCPLSPFAETATLADIYNACIQRFCVADVHKSECQLDVTVDDSLSCGLNKSDFVLSVTEAGLKSVDCAQVSDASDGQGSSIALGCGGSCVVQLESGSGPFLEMLPPIDPYALAGCRTDVGGFTQGLVVGDVLLLSLSGCDRVVSIDWRRGSLLATAPGGQDWLAADPISGKLIALWSNRIIVSDPNTLERLAVLNVIPGSQAVFRPQAFLAPHGHELVIAAGVLSDDRMTVDSGLLYAVSLSAGATSARTLFDIRDPSDVGYLVSDPLLGSEPTTFFLVEHLSPTGEAGVYRARRRDLRSGQALDVLPGLDRVASLPRLLHDPSRDRLIATYDGRIRACSLAGDCLVEGKPIWEDKSYGPMAVLEQSNSIVALIIGAQRAMLGHELDTLERRPGAIRKFDDTAPAAKVLLLAAPDGRTLLALGRMIQRFSAR